MFVDPKKIGEMHLKPVATGSAGSDIESLIKESLAPVDLVTRSVGISDTRTQNITILHTSDLHGHAEAFSDPAISKENNIGGLPYLGAAIQKEKQKDSENTLLLDAGDISTGGPISDYFKAIPMVDAMNLMGYDAMTVGNHEFDSGREALKGIIENAKFPVLSANLVERSSNEKSLDVKPYIMKQVGDLKIGILGLTTQETKVLMNESDKKALEFASATETAKTLIPRMKEEGADLIVLLSHLGHENDRKLASEVEGIDVIIGGHSHTELKSPIKVGNTVLAQAGCFGKNLGKMKLDVEYGKGPARIVGVKSELIPIISKDIQPDPHVESIIKKYSEQLTPIMNRKIGVAKTELFQKDYHVFREESPLANYVTDAMRRHTGAEISVITTSSLRSNIDRGAITVGKIHQLFPWDNKVSIVKLTGNDIKQLLEEILSGALYGFAVSGIKVMIDTSLPRGKQVIGIKMENGKPFNLKKIYRVATRDWLADGNGNLEVFKNIRDRRDTDEDLKEILISDIEREGVISSRYDGRIRNFNDMSSIA